MSMRLPKQVGEWISRDKQIRFTFEGKEVATTFLTIAFVGGTGFFFKTVFLEATTDFGLIVFAEIFFVDFFCTAFFEETGFLVVAIILFLKIIYGV